MLRVVLDPRRKERSVSKTVLRRVWNVRSVRSTECKEIDTVYQIDTGRMKQIHLTIVESNKKLRGWERDDPTENVILCFTVQIFLKRLRYLFRL